MLGEIINIIKQIAPKLYNWNFMGAVFCFMSMLLYASVSKKFDWLVIADIILIIGNIILWIINTDFKLKNKNKDDLTIDDFL